MEQAWHQGWSVTQSEEWCLTITGSIAKVLIAYFMGTSSFNISLPLRRISTLGMKSHTVSSVSLLSSWRWAKHAGMWLYWWSETVNSIHLTHNDSVDCLILYQYSYHLVYKKWFFCYQNPIISFFSLLKNCSWLKILYNFHAYNVVTKNF